MTLKEYLILTDTTQKQFAARFDVTPGLVNQWISGLVRISPERALQIEKATAGVLTRHDLCPNFPWEEAAAAAPLLVKASGGGGQNNAPRKN